MIPISRVEMYLAKICGEDVELPIPQTRKEVFLAIIAGEDYEKPVPSSRVELYLAKILGDDVPLPLPQSREEIFLAKIAGVEHPLPYPESRIEYWLHKWATYEEWETISGNPVSFTAKAAPLRKLQIAFSPVQDLHGQDAPYPAGGGKNKFGPNENQYQGAFLNSRGDAEPASGWNFSDYIAVTPKTMYTFTPNSTYGASAYYAFYDSSKQLLSVIESYDVLARSHGTFTTPADAYFMRFSYRDASSDIQLELGSSATSYAPYSNLCPISGWDSLTVYHSGADTSDPQTISISLGETVYSGWVDAVTGVGEVTHIHQDITAFGGVFDSTANGFAVYVGISGAIHTNATKCVSNIFKWSGEGYPNMPLYSFGGNSGVNETMTFILPSTITSKAEADAWLANNPTECVFQLANPIPIQLTPQEINSLAGDNVMWTDADSLTVEYRSN